MGCDIHTVTERRVNGAWHAAFADNPVFDWRSYGMYGFLADVRNYSDVPAQWPKREWPEDASQTALELRERWDGDGHSHTYVTLAELLAHDYNSQTENRRVTRKIGDNCWDGGCTAEPGGGKTMTWREFLDGAFFDDLDRLKQLGAPEDVRVLMFFDN